MQIIHYQPSEPAVPAAKKVPAYKDPARVRAMVLELIRDNNARLRKLQNKEK